MIRFIGYSVLCFLFHANLNAAPLPYVNELRAQAGIPPLVHNEKLQKAANNHAKYLKRHHRPNSKASAHDESDHHRGFTGSNPTERAIYVHYPHRQVLENISIGETGWRKAIDSLMGAIYHRLVFLNFHMDEMGSAQQGKNHVFELGRSDITLLCDNPPQAALLRSAVKCGDQLVSRSYFEALCHNLPANAVYREPWPESCPNGKMLDALYMKNLCGNPPSVARFSPPGRYYLICNKKLKVSKQWFISFCSHPPKQAQHRGGNRYFNHCGKRIRSEWLTHACNNAPQAALENGSRTYADPCGKGRKIKIEYLRQIDRRCELLSQNLVVWPSENATDIPPAFYEEDPDPLPDLSVSGYPISVQVNPGYGKKVTLQAFRLYRLEKGQSQEVGKVRILSQENDPNQVLDARTFVLFPLRRLSWNQTYRVRLEMDIDGQTIEKSWGFQTMNPKGSIIDLSSTHLPLLDNHKDYALYRPDKPIGKVTARYPKSMQLNILAIDQHTLGVRISADKCGRIEIRLEDGKRIGLKPAICGN